QARGHGALLVPGALVDPRLLELGREVRVGEAREVALGRLELLQGVTALALAHEERAERHARAVVLAAALEAGPERGRRAVRVFSEQELAAQELAARRQLARQARDAQRLLAVDALPLRVRAPGHAAPVLGPRRALAGLGRHLARQLVAQQGGVRARPARLDRERREHALHERRELGVDL